MINPWRLPLGSHRGGILGRDGGKGEHPADKLASLFFIFRHAHKEAAAAP